jgi:uncharacterized membrane protein
MHEGRKTMRRLTRYFIEGLLFLVPVVATIYIVYIVFVKVDGLIRFEVPGLGIRVPGLGFLATVFLIMLIGFIASNFLTRRLTSLIDKVFMKLPLVKLLYTSVKDLIGAFVGDKKGFNKPVAVTVSPGSNVSVLGFITAEDLSSFGLAEKVAVYLPQSYNFAGNMIVVSKEQVQPLEADSGDFMTFIVSGGISTKKMV